MGAKTYLVTCQERNQKTGRMETIVSHGINAMGDIVILPQERLEIFKPKKDSEGFYID